MAQGTTRLQSRAHHLSDHKPTDEKLKDLQATERHRQRFRDKTSMRKLVDSPQVKRLLSQIGRNIAERQEREGPRTYRCFACHDTGFVLESHPSKLGYDAVHGAPCEACKDPGFASLMVADIEKIRSIPWVIDGDLAKDRLRYREEGQPTLWVYPDGRRCSYDGTSYKQLAPIPNELYRELFATAKRMKRTSPPEITNPLRR